MFGNYKDRKNQNPYAVNKRAAFGINAKLYIFNRDLNFLKVTKQIIQECRFVNERIGRIIAPP
ncbi:hypothetical protein ADIS_2562 [Lunatimonas lonarensis]|uniref:Uncharacterized protein n=1 Tax=Lunatimonas lonarensis TaxID=1232681 RepID=R7ZRX5_9BACT|nr:hypothetical protein ADIS_2562 [Lunatimonas lonarensis]